jgi:hypothetical protein
MHGTQRKSDRNIMRVVSVCLAAQVVSLAIAPPARADKPAPPTSYKTMSPDKAYVFVMISPRTVERDAGALNEWKGQEIREIRRKYTQSGLYRNDGSTDPPLWTVDWYAHHIIVASDGVHLIRHGPWPSSTNQEAIAFFANGELLRTYQIKELVDIPFLLPHSVSHFEWLKSDAFDESKLEYSVTTYDGSRILFDARTGEIVSSLRPARMVGFPIAIGGVGVLAWLIIRRWRRKHQERSEIPIATNQSNRQS